MFVPSALARISVFARVSILGARSFCVAAHFVHEDFWSRCHHRFRSLLPPQVFSPTSWSGSGRRVSSGEKARWLAFISRLHADRFLSPAWIRCDSVVDSLFWLCLHLILSFALWVPPLSVISTDLRPSSCLCGPVRADLVLPPSIL